MYCGTQLGGLTEVLREGPVFSLYPTLSLLEASSTLIFLGGGESIQRIC